MGRPLEEAQVRTALAAIVDRHERIGWKFTVRVLESWLAQARVIELALNGIPDPMHPGIPPKFVDGLAAAQVVLSAALGHDDPGNVEVATAYLAAGGETETPHE